MAVVPAAWIPCNTFLSTNAVDTVGILQTFYYARWIGSIVSTATADTRRGLKRL
jgi:hypothetical protein